MEADGRHMSRELNPDLFPDSQKMARPRDTALPMDSAGASDVALKAMARQFELVKRSVKEMESRLEATNIRLNEFINAVKGRYDRLTGGLQRLEELTKSGLRDLIDRHAQMASRLNDRKVGDAKIQELVDRHNQLVQNFEIRLAQVQKIVGEQEMQLMSSKSELREAQKELVRMKRL
jgi:hypothetical protein